MPQNKFPTAFALFFPLAGIASSFLNAE